METTKITVSIIEDSEIHSEWLKEKVLDNNFLELVSIDNNGLSGIKSAKKYHPDVILLDFQLTDITGIEVAKRVKAHTSQTKIFVLTAHTEASIIERMVSDKNIDAIAVKGSFYFEDNFIRAVHTVAKGESYLDPSLLKTFRQAKRTDVLEKLTKREFEIFIQTTIGKSDTKIAEDLFVDVTHIKNSKSKILKKIKIRNIDHFLSKIIENSRT